MEETVKKTFCSNLDELLEALKIYAEIVICDGLEVRRQQYHLVLLLLQEVLPEVIELYLKLDSKDETGNQAYWVSQLGRIVEALEGEDSFVQLDVLYFETYKNLLRVREMIE